MFTDFFVSPEITVAATMLTEVCAQNQFIIIANKGLLYVTVNASNVCHWMGGGSSFPLFPRLLLRV